MDRNKRKIYKNCKEEAPPWGESREDTLLPPTRRCASSNTPTPTSSLDSKGNKRSRNKKWSIDGLFKKVSSILEHSASASTLSSSSFEELQSPTRSKKNLTGEIILKYCFWVYL